MKYIEQKKLCNYKKFGVHIRGLFLLIFLCFSLESLATQITLKRIIPTRVEYYQNQISRDFKKNSLIRTALVAGLFSTLAYGAYKIYTASSPEAVPTVISKDAISSETMDTLKSFADTLRTNSQLIAKQTFFEKIKGWFKDAFVMMVNQAGALCILDLMRGVANPITKYIFKLDNTFDKAIQSIFYTKSLNWFLEKHTQFFSFIDEIEKNCSSIENETNDSTVGYTDSLEKNWEIATEQLSSAVAFMTIMMEKKAHYSALLSIRGKAIIEKISEIMNNAAQSIEQSYNTQTKPTVSGKIKILKLLLQQEFESFNKIESAQLYQ